MGAVHGGQRSNRRSHQQPDCSTRDSIQSSHRREMARFGNDGLCVRRHPPILLSPDQGSESYKDEITLRLSEWAALRKIIQQIHQRHPMLAAADTCSRQLDHQNLQLRGVIVHRVQPILRPSVSFYSCIIYWLFRRWEKRALDVYSCKQWTISSSY